MLLPVAATIAVNAATLLVKKRMLRQLGKGGCEPGSLGPGNFNMTNGTASEV